LPALIHGNPQKALIIGFGSGATVGTLINYPSIKQIDVLEISEAVIDAAVFFKEINNDCLKSDKVNIIIDDAKSFLAINTNKYDLIISEPSNPWVAGTASLMTVETFEQFAKALNQDGILLQWMHNYEMQDKLLRRLIR